jgi:putative membrane protein
MIVRKTLKLSIVINNAKEFIAFMVLISAGVLYMHAFYHAKQPKIPFAFVAALGTALAIFLAFRNNSSYDRWWEARKIWGGIVNNSRTWARQVMNLMDPGDRSGSELVEMQKVMIYRHLAWVNALRLQLRRQTTWEEIDPFLHSPEFIWLMERQNKATHLINAQGGELRMARDSGMIDGFRWTQMDSTLTELYNLQGMCERIKNTPLPRQYDYFPRLFLYLFVVILPFGMIEELHKVDSEFMLIPLATAIAFVFYVLMKIGEFNEDPFENRITDTPMTALCRTIEIDLREMLGETDLPPKKEPVDGFLF